MLKRYFHVSIEHLGPYIKLEPRLPGNCVVEKEGNIPRICVSPLIHHCFRAVSSSTTDFNVKDLLDHGKLLKDFGEPDEEYVERIPFIRSQAVYYTEHTPYTPPDWGDFRKNKEMWFLKKTEFLLAGYIDLDYLVKERKIRVINDVNEISTKVYVAMPKNVRITYTVNNVEAFRKPTINKGMKCLLNKNLNEASSSSLLQPAL